MPPYAGQTSLFTLVICTYNRADQLRRALETALQQRTDGLFDYEIVVVDNNSTDATRRVVERCQERAAHPLVYIFEPEQGKSHALNIGLGAVATPYYAVIDDDMLLPPNWLLGMFDGVQRCPDAAFLGGKVLPAWSAAPPSWLTNKHWSAIAVADYGDEEIRVDITHQICLLAATHRTADVRSVGGYVGNLGVSAARIGSVEDVELLARLWSTGGYGVYLPNVRLQHRIGSERISKQYHRRWHRGHGRFYALMREPETEGTGRRLLDVPLYMVRELGASMFTSVRDSILGSADAAFAAEARVWFLLGFCVQRLRGLIDSRRGKSRVDRVTPWLA